MVIFYFDKGDNKTICIVKILKVRSWLSITFKHQINIKHTYNTHEILNSFWLNKCILNTDKLQSYPASRESFNAYIG